MLLVMLVPFTNIDSCVLLQFLFISLVLSSLFLPFVGYSLTVSPLMSHSCSVAQSLQKLSVSQPFVIFPPHRHSDSNTASLSSSPSLSVALFTQLRSRRLSFIPVLSRCPFTLLFTLNTKLFPSVIAL